LELITVQLGCPAIAANRCWGILRMNNSTNKNLNSSREFVLIRGIHVW
jgi:hypothetical protein